MNRRILISDFTLGQLSNRYAGKIDSEARGHGAETIVGFVLHPDGGLRRRKGTVHVRHGLGITPASDELYNDNGIPGFAVYRYSGDSWLAYFSSTTHVLGYKLTTGSSMSIATSSLEYGHELWTEGTFVNPDDSISYLHLRTPDDDVLLNLTSDSLTRPADYDMGVIFQNRHVVAEADTGDVAMSVPLDYDNFLTTATDPALEATPDFAGVETVKWLKARQGLYLGTDAAEYELYSNYGYFSEELGGLMLRKISGVGARIASYFGPYMVLARDDRLIAMQSAGGAFTYEMRSLTESIDNGEWLNVDSVEYGTHRYLIALDRDGDLYCYLQSPGTQVAGWTKLRESVGWFTVYDKDLYVAYAKSSAYRVDVFPLDSLTFPGDRTAREQQLFGFNDVHGEGGGYLTVGSSVSGDVLPASSTMRIWTIGAAGSTYKGTQVTDAAGALASSTLKTLVGYTSSILYCYAYVSGDTPEGKIITLPLTLDLGKKSRVSNVVLQMWNSRGAKVRVNSGAWETWSTDTSYSGAKEFTVVAAHALECRIEVQPLSDMPLNIYQIMADVTGGEV